MLEEAENVAILKKAYEQWHTTKGDPNIWLDILDDEVDFGSIANGMKGLEFTKPRASKKEVMGYFDELFTDWEMESFKIQEYVAQGGRVVALGNCAWTHKRTGKTIQTPKVDVWLFENGKAVQFMEHFDTYAAKCGCE